MSQQPTVEITKTLQVSPTTRIDVVREISSNKLIGICIILDVPNTAIHQNVSISAIMFPEVIEFLQKEMMKK